MVAALPVKAQPTEDGVRTLLSRLEQAVQTGEPADYSELLLPAVSAAPASASRASNFTALEFRRGVTRVVIQERDRQDLPGTLPGNGYRLVVDAMIEYGDRGRVATWQLDIRRVDETEWLIADQE